MILRRARPGAKPTARGHWYSDGRMRRRVVTVVGARPQFVKAGVVSRILRDMGDAAPYEEVLVHTGQHYDALMSDVFFQELGIPEPKHALGVGSGTPAFQIARMVEALWDVLRLEKPDAVLAYGDTNSTVAAALCASHQDTPFVHVEAGERIFRRREVPEEVNRVVSDNAASLCLTSTRRAERYLRREGFHPARVRFVGDTMFDLFLEGEATVQAKAQVGPGDWGLAPGEYHLATIHRAQNTTGPEALLPLLEAMDAASMPVLLPIHPRTKKLAEQCGWSPKGSLKFIDALGYYDFLAMLLQCCRVVTDSGGVTREAFFAGKPCIIPMENSWWVEIVDAGWALEVGSDANALREALDAFVPSSPAPVGLFGKGDAGRQTIEAVGDFLHEGHKEGLWHRHGRLDELPPPRGTTFTLDTYRGTLKGLLSKGYVFRTFPSYLSEPKPFTVLMRHDIDFTLEAAVRMARVEAEEGVQATYFLMLRTEHYNVFSREGSERVREILGLGHHLALHFDCASYPVTLSSAELAKACSREAEMLEQWFGHAVEVVSYHRPAPNVLTGDPALSAPRPHTYMKVFTSGGIEYLSDSRGEWRQGGPTASAEQNQGGSLHVLVHPVWWTEIATSPYEVLQQVEDQMVWQLEHSMAANCTVYQVGHLKEDPE